MTETFECASCSAPLDFEGTPIQKCKFCGSTVIVPSALLGSRPDGHSPLTGRALKIAEIRDLIASGNKLMAIKVFRETFGVGLKEARDAVEALERGSGVDLGLDAEKIEMVKKIGYTVGGSILGTAVIVIVVTVGLIGAILYFTFRTVDKAIGTAANSVTTGSKTSDRPSVATEILKFGGEGNGPGRFKDNRLVAVDTLGRIFSVEFSGGRLQVFDASGKFQAQWQAGGDVPIRDMAADRQGNIVIVDSKGISRFDASNGRLIKRLDRIRAESIAVMLDKRIVVAGREGITILDADLNILQDFKKAGEAANASFGFTNVAVNGEGTIFAVDRQNGDVCKFSSDGRFLNRFPINSRSPNAIAIDPGGRILISQTSKIDVFDETGRPITSFPSIQAFGLAFDDAGNLFVASRPFVVKYELKF